MRSDLRPAAARSPAAAAAGALAAALLLAAGCGLNVKSPDLFMLARTGQGQTLTLLVNDAGTIRCNGGQARPLPDPLLLEARDLATALDKDAKAHLELRGGSSSVYAYSVRVQGGTVSFPDTAALHHSELAQAEQFALDAAHGPCGLPR